MNVIKKTYIFDEQHKKVAVQIPIETYKRIEEILENYGLAKLMDENEEGKLSLQEAKEYYSRLEKK